MEYVVLPPPELWADELDPFWFLDGCVEIAVREL